MKILSSFKYELLFILCAIASAFFPRIVYAESLRLPYAKGESFVVVQGYDSPPTHVNKDMYAIDFSQNGCNAYGKSIVAAESGTVILSEEQGYNGGYGAEVLIDIGNKVVNRYAHLMSGSVVVQKGQIIPQGTVLGTVGNTGLVTGKACPEHPGAHLHFAAYKENAGGTYKPIKPEPISGYTNITENNWYLSDNAVDKNISDNSGIAFGPSSKENAIISTTGNAPETLSMDQKTIITDDENVSGIDDASVIEGKTTLATEDIQGTGSTSILVEQIPSSTKNMGSNMSAPISGGVSASPAPMIQALINAQPLVSAGSLDPAPEIPSTSISIAPQQLSAEFNSSTMDIDLFWQSISNSGSDTIYSIVDATSSSGINGTLIGVTTGTMATYPVTADGAPHYIAIEENNGSSTPTILATTSITLPSWNETVQSDDSAVSYPSWYDDNWYNLGTGFYGTIRALTLEGHINDPDYYASHLSLEEFLDSDYETLDQTFAISDNAPFTATSSKITINNLNIPLQPNKYYRLTTYQDYQNRSVILLGTNATGTAGHDSYIIKVGRVEATSTFYPYIAWTFMPDYPPLVPPNPVGNIRTDFDAANLQLSISWSATSNADTPSSFLTYQINIGTSTVIDPAAWQSVGKNVDFTTPVVFGNQYTIGVRAMDDLGNLSSTTIASWYFPNDYFPLPSQLGHDDIVDGSPEKFHLSNPTQLSGVALWTDPGTGPYRGTQSYAIVYNDHNGSAGDIIATTTPIYWGHDQWYTFPEPVALSAGDYWLGIGAGLPLSNSPIVYGSSGQMYFRLQMAN